ncbi:hypothetical protein VMCG_02210 [Cytospora schulzeri]|uniref:Aminotransferase n=1 Tax=Cytospora schulzeri TaxID=448051 RepID=A0A423X1U5_9PEZI|nr:hypothetical protein VMCG_02210 [Valsa malicola]
MSQINITHGAPQANGVHKVNSVQQSAVLHRHLHHDFLNVARGEGHYLVLEDGRKLFDASGGAAVACIGHGNTKVNQAMMEQIDKLSYCASTFLKTPIVEEAGRMMKLARQYFLEKVSPEPQRTRFISRYQSYHGTTLGSLSMGGHAHRRAKFEPMLVDVISKVSPCFAYRGKDDNESDESYVQRLALELDLEFQRVGPESVCAFVAEPVVGAALGCVPAVPGYFKAMQAVCKKHGALLILDEVMSGMGRTGTYHAWQQEGVVPDIQTVGKGLGGGYQPVAGLLIHKKIVDALEEGSGTFVHGHTYQGHAVGCAAIVAVQKTIQQGNLLANVRAMGDLLEKLLRERLSSHPHVGDIRGRGLFWAIELVQDKATKTPFPARDSVAMEISELALTDRYSMMVYPGAGTADGVNGDHIILAPPYTVTAEEVEHIVQTVSRVIVDYFSQRSSKAHL